MTGLRHTVVIAVLALVTVLAHAQSATRVRGTITAFDGKVLSVKTRDGKDVKLALADNAAVVAAKAIRLEDLKPGDFVGSTTRARPDGTHAALEVHSLAPTTKPGQLPWDLEPGTTMTNGYVGSVSTAGNQELVLDYKTGTQRITVPPGTPVVTFVEADRSYLKPGEYIWAAAQPGPDGNFSVQRVSVSHGGVRPPH